MDNETVIKKVPLDALIGVMVELYNKGVDYIDIIAQRGEIQDKMHIAFTKEYMTPEAAKELSEQTDDIEISTKLTDEDYNQLI